MMEGTESKYRIPLFDGTNFGNWKFRMETLFNELDLTEFTQKAYTEMVIFAETDQVDERSAKQSKLDAYQKNDKKCRSHIIQRIAHSHLEYVKDKNNVFEI